jgi:hypothetical protein
LIPVDISAKMSAVRVFIAKPEELVRPNKGWFSVNVLSLLTSFVISLPLLFLGILMVEILRRIREDERRSRQRVPVKTKQER